MNSRCVFDQKYEQPLLGIDEVGVGCIAGPMVACGVILPEDTAVWNHLVQIGTKDSKKMTELSRMKVHDAALALGIWNYVAWVYPSEIDKIGAGETMLRLYREIIEAAKQDIAVKTVIIDGTYNTQLGKPHQAVKKADDKSLAVAAASCVAKFCRDSYMIRLGDRPRYRAYGWDSNKGYPTELHRKALKEHGVTPHHRRSYKPVATALRESHQAAVSQRFGGPS